MDVPPFMCSLDLNVMHALKFPEYANIGVADLEDGDFKIGMTYSSKKSVIITAIRSYTISRGVNYIVYEFKPQTFYAKCKTYGRGKKLVRRFGDTIGGTCVPWKRFSQDHSKLASNTIAEAMKPLIESDPSISNFLMEFKVLYLQKLVVTLGIQGQWRSTKSTTRGCKNEARHMLVSATISNVPIGYWHFTRDIDGVT
ncbi:hypothetical protein Ahy_B02g060980 [Arachis hypogaea]|uniref:Uncharacterized protein n=1 Tax=Arachis hypogaea TaxID=3818 RepID=A0A445AJR0_ARAHY|nr:hypothetical protein Ahy_B02g060980 [Arachis hypogaea]